jgi:hypothetical protein
MTFICLAAFSIVLFTINPKVTNWIGFSLFYVSLFLTITGAAAIVGFLIRFLALKQELIFRSVKEAFRQSFLFSSLIVISLLLVSQNLFTWLNLLFLVLGLSILEFILISYDSRA